MRDLAPPARDTARGPYGRGSPIARSTVPIWREVIFLAVVGPTTIGTSPDVVLAVEVVSADSDVRDREREPQLYAEAGMPHFWHVEHDSERPIVYAYELDAATKSCVPTGIYHDRLKTTVPFDIDIDLTEIDELRG